MCNPNIYFKNLVKAELNTPREWNLLLKSPMKNVG